MVLKYVFGTIYAQNDSNSSNHAIWCQNVPVLALCGAKILVSAVKCNRNEFLSIICNTMVPKHILTPYGAKTMSIVPMVLKRVPFWHHRHYNSIVWHHMALNYVLAPVSYTHLTLPTICSV